MSSHVRPMGTLISARLIHPGEEGAVWIHIYSHIFNNNLCNMFCHCNHYILGFCLYVLYPLQQKDPSSVTLPEVSSFVFYLLKVYFG